MNKIYLYCFLFIGSLFSETEIQAQSCAALNATFQTYESRCAATGAIKIFTTGGSGDYKYKAIGPVNTNFTSSDSITGLSAGVYSIEVSDINLHCNKTFANIIVGGDYSDPRFGLDAVDVSCDHGNNGEIWVTGLSSGREPFTFSIVAPSPMGVGTSNDSGIFTGLIAGDYSIRLTDSCGGIQTRTVTIKDYSWWIDSYSFTKYSCNSVSGYIKVIDSRGNVSTITGIPGMQYAIVRSPGDTLWSSDPNFDFPVNGEKSIVALAIDSCHNIKKVGSALSLVPSLGSSVKVTEKICSTFTASVTSITNFFNPQFCIYDSLNQELECNTTGKFENLAYGDYCIKAHDECTDSIITRCFSVKAPKSSVDADVNISDKTCDSFTASMTGQTNFARPYYCLYSDDSTLIGCDSTGIFTGLSYGSYCITIKNDCPDTTITRCFTVQKPLPRIPDVIIPEYVNCVNFGIDIQGDSLTNPRFCLTDTLGNIIGDCNDTGIFDSIPLGSYCITIHDDCLDTTFTRCFNVGPPVAVNDLSVSISNKTCSTFTATLYTSSMAGSAYCLYDQDNHLILCDSSGRFPNLAYGSYCIEATSTCPDTTLRACFSPKQPKPSVGASVNINGRKCNTFNVQIKDPKNLTNPLYYLVDNNGDTLTSNNSGKFNSLSYGDYCVLIKDGCYDTTIKRCFSAVAPNLNVTVSASKSCDYGFSRFNVSVSTYPADVYVYDSSYTLLKSSTANGSLIIDNISEPPGDVVKVVAVDACGNSDTVTVSWVAAYFNNRTEIKQKCPGAVWANGSGDISSIITTNTGPVTVRIIKKNGLNLSPSLVPDYARDSVFTFQDLGPGSYILRYQTNDGCNKTMYDTVIINPYTYPNLSRSSGYQCDVNGFSVGAVVSGGAGPFTYEIIGSSPSVPPIIAGPQASPVFSVNNGYNYSLVRLRALDACGNATLGDASILPLASNGIQINENCLGTPTTLKVDTIYNSTITWYFKQKETDEDSVYLGNGFQYHIDELLYTDTGYYYCRISVNDGCINRLYQFHLDASCYPVLPVVLVEMNGYMRDGKSYLSWSIRNDAGLRAIYVERKQGSSYNTIGSLKPGEYTSVGFYNFTDEDPLAENYYRLKLEFDGGKVIYSKVVFLRSSGTGLITVFPNPAINKVKIVVPEKADSQWEVQMMSLIGQRTILNRKFSGSYYIINRLPTMVAGVYILKLTNIETGRVWNYRLIFNDQ